MSVAFAWRDFEGADPRVEFSVKPHEMNPETVHLWIDPKTPSTGEAIASLDVTLDDAEALGNALLTAVRHQRERIERGETAP